MNVLFRKIFEFLVFVGKLSLHLKSKFTRELWYYEAHHKDVTFKGIIRAKDPDAALFSAQKVFLKFGYQESDLEDIRFLVVKPYTFDIKL